MFDKLKMNYREILGTIIAGCLVALTLIYATDVPNRESWDDGYMHGYYHGNSDGVRGESAPVWLEDLRRD